MYLTWSQFQDLLNICLTMLDLSLYYRQDPAMDVSRRGDPKYVGRVISSMVRKGQLSPNPTSEQKAPQRLSHLHPKQQNELDTVHYRQFILCILSTGLFLDQWER